MSDVGAVFWKEFREAFQFQRRDYAQLASLGIMAVIFFVVLPLQLNEFYFAVSTAVGSGTFLASIQAMFRAADSFAGERERHTLETLLASRLPDRSILWGKFLGLIAVAYLLGGALQLVGLLSAAAIFGRWESLPFLVALALGANLAGLPFTALLAGLGTLISMRASTVQQAMQFVSLLMFVVILAPSFSMGFVGPALGDFFARLTPLGVALLVGGLLVGVVVLDALVLAGASAMFRRHRLMRA